MVTPTIPIMIIHMIKCMMQVVINRGWNDDATYAKTMIYYSDGHYAKPEWAKPYDTLMAKTTSYDTHMFKHMVTHIIKQYDRTYGVTCDKIKYGC